METIFTIAICLIGIAWFGQLFFINSKGWDSLADDEKRNFLIHTVVYFVGTFIFCSVYIAK